jgi:transcriptional regulator with XRE-family HTH domain
MTTMHRLRLARGQSLRQLARAIGGISHETVRRIEQGRTDVAERTRYAVEQHFGLPLETLTAPVNTNAAAHKGDGAGGPTTTATTPRAS